MAWWVTKQEREVCVTPAGLSEGSSLSDDEGEVDAEAEAQKGETNIIWGGGMSSVLCCKQLAATD